MNYFDCHIDTLTMINEDCESLAKNNCDVDLERIDTFAVNYGQIFALWADAKKSKGNIDEEFLQIYGKAVKILKEAEDRMMWCKSASDMDAAFKAGKAAGFLSIEDASIMGSHISNIRELGFSFAMLTWNYENAFAAGAALNQNRGLSEYGRRITAELMSQGIIMDISHLSDKGAEDIFSMTDKAVMASHSNVRDLCKKPRNLTKMQITELIRRNGFIGIDFYKPFVSEEEAAGIKGLLNHMDYILNLGGEDVLGIGSDFDGCAGNFTANIEGVQSIPALREAMVKNGFGEKLADKIMFDNAYSFLHRNLN